MKYRLQKLLGDCEKKIGIVPLDHGVTFGPIKGIDNYSQTIKEVIAGGINTFILHKGLFKFSIEKNRFHESKFIMHLSASTNLFGLEYKKVIVTDVEHALSMGADGVSIHINLDTKTETDELKTLGEIADYCYKWGMPLLVMMNFVNPEYEHDVKRKKHMVHIAEELGADIVKIKYFSQLSDVVESTNLPIVVAGGEFIKGSYEILDIINDIRLCDAKGFAIGRNIITQDDIRATTRLYLDLLNGNITYHDAYLSMKNKVSTEGT